MEEDVSDCNWVAMSELPVWITLCKMVAVNLG